MKDLGADVSDFYKTKALRARRVKLMKEIDVLESMFAEAQRLIVEVKPEQLGNATPCPMFAIRDLLNHMCAWIRVFDGSVNERVLDFDPMTFSLDSDWAESFAASAKGIIGGLRANGFDRPMTMTSDPMPGSFIFDMLTMEYIGHGLDLSAATKHAHAFTDEQAEAALAAATRIIQPQYRGTDEGLFHPAVEVSPTAPAVDRFVGFLGRNPHWTAG
jgi:uncharacterized protein (TIGR03086 family)